MHPILSKEVLASIELDASRTRNDIMLAAEATRGAPHRHSFRDSALHPLRAAFHAIWHAADPRGKAMATIPSPPETMDFSLEGKS